MEQICRREFVLVWSEYEHSRVDPNVIELHRLIVESGVSDGPSRGQHDIATLQFPFPHGFVFCFRDKLGFREAKSVRADVLRVEEKAVRIGTSISVGN